MHRGLMPLSVPLCACVRVYTQSMQQYVSGKLDVAKRQVRDARARHVTWQSAAAGGGRVV